MDNHQTECLSPSLPDIDEAALGDRNFDADPLDILIESSDPQKLRFQLIQWLAESPNRKVKTERKQQISGILNVSPRQVERLLNQYHEDALSETSGVQRSDKGTHRTDDYWQEYIRNTYEQSVKDKHSLKPLISCARSSDMHSSIWDLKKVTIRTQQLFTGF